MIAAVVVQPLRARPRVTNGRATDSIVEDFQIETGFPTIGHRVMRPQRP
jgi:hypothetical protein